MESESPPPNIVIPYILHIERRNNMDKKQFIEHIKPLARAIFVENQYNIGRYNFICCEANRRINKYNIEKSFLYQDPIQDENNEYPIFTIVVNEHTTKNGIVTSIKDVIIH
jgi:hypothetical protein